MSSKFTAVSQFASRAADSTDRRRTTRDYFLCKFYGGPLNEETRKLERIDRVLTFTTTTGAVQYIRTSRSQVLTKYTHLTAELQAEMDFEHGLEQVAAFLDDSDTEFHWVLAFPYSDKGRDTARECGFRWDGESREWYINGSRSALREALQIAKEIPGAELICEPMPS